jgi:malate dehydrogenase (quinone)
MINGEKQLLFGPLLVFQPDSKKWILFRLAFIHKPDNIFPMLSAGIKNIPLTKYLIQQVRQSPKRELMRLRNMYRVLSLGLIIERAGQRVQVIKR